MIAIPGDHAWVTTYLGRRRDDASVELHVELVLLLPGREVPDGERQMGLREVAGDGLLGHVLGVNVHCDSVLELVVLMPARRRIC